jgi:hypothetical protein
MDKEAEEQIQDEPNNHTFGTPKQEDEQQVKLQLGSNIKSSHLSIDSIQ